MCTLDHGSNATSAKRSYRPVVIVHGLMTGDVSTMEHLAARIVKLHPGTKTYVIDRFCGLASLEPLYRQTKQLADDLLRICSLHPEGVHVIGYSQGGLIARGMLEMYGTVHNVKTFVSLSSPQGGQYGAECFMKLFPALTTRTAYEVFYTRLGQHAISVANFWYDPHHRDLFLKYSLYLAIIDNYKHHDFLTAANSTTTTTGGYFTIVETNDELTKTMESRVSAAVATVASIIDRVTEGYNCDDKSDANCVNVDSIMADFSINDADINYWANSDDDSNANMRKLGLTRLQHLVLIGGPDDGVISPWQSSQFAILDSSGKLVPMRERREDDVYSDNDPIGLRQLDVTNRLVEYTVPEVNHHEWHHSEKVLRECIINWLD